MFETTNTVDASGVDEAAGGRGVSVGVWDKRTPGERGSDVGQLQTPGEPFRNLSAVPLSGPRGGEREKAKQKKYLEKQQSSIF